MFDRKRRRNISIYASGTKLETRGRFYSEDDLVDYDIMSYDMDATFAPERYWINGTAHMRVRVRAGAMTTMTLKLAEALTVRGVYAPGFGRLLHLRVVNQNSLIVNLPAPVFRDNEFALTIIYSGRLEPSELDREAIAVQQTAQQEREPLVIPLEPRYIYSNNWYWYPQSTVSDYALGTVHITVPNEFDVVATWHLDGASKAGHRDAGRGTPSEDVRFPERSAGSLPLVRHQPHDVGDVDASADQAIEWRFWRRARGHSGSRRAGSAGVGASGVDKSGGRLLHPPTRPASL